MANLATISNNILADSGIDSITVVVGSGTVNYIPKFTASGTIGNSAITDNGTTVTLISRALAGTSAAFTGAVSANNPSEGATGEGLIAGRSFKIDGTGSGQRAVMYVVSNVLSDTYGSGLQIQGANFAGDKAFGFNLNTSGGFELYTKSGSFAKALTAKATQQIQFNAYGSGTFTGTRAYDLSIDSSGNIIEVPVGAGTVTGSGTANEITYWTGSSSIGSLTTATYPSLTELSYVKGVTSSIQTQLNAKQATLTLTTTGTSGAATLVGATLNIPQYQSVLTNPVTGTGTTNYVSKWTSSSAIGNSQIFDNGTNVGINTTTLDSRLVSSYGTLTTFDNTNVATTTSLLLTAADPGTTSSNHAVSLAFRPIVNRGAVATLTVFNDSVNKEGGTVITFNSGGGAYPSSTTEKFRIWGDGKTRLSRYGSGLFTGTVAYNLAVNSNGDIIEITDGGGTVTGTGTANYIPKWTSSSAIGNSIMYDNGSAISIGSTSPGVFKLYVDGTIRGIATFSTYVNDGLFSANARPSTIEMPNGSLLVLGYYSSGNGVYYGRIGWSTATEKVSFGAAATNTFRVGVGISDTQMFTVDSGGITSSGTTTTVGGSSSALFSFGVGGIGVDRSQTNNAIWFNNSTADTNHVLWNDYYGGPNARGSAGSGFDGMKWNVLRGIYFLGGSSGAYNTLTIANSGGGNNDHTVSLYASNVLRLATATTGVNVTGTLLVNTTSTSPNTRLSQGIGTVQTGGATFGGMAMTTYGGTVYYPVLDFQTSNGTTDGSYTIVTDGRQLGDMVFRAADGTAFRDTAAVRAFVDGTPSAGSTPGRLVFATNPSAGMVNRVAIFSDGNMSVGAPSSNTGSRFQVSGSSTAGVPIVDIVVSSISGTFSRGVRMLASGMTATQSLMYAVGQSDNSKNMGQLYFYYAGAGSNSNRLSMGLHSVDDKFSIFGTGNISINTTTDLGVALGVAGSIKAFGGYVASTNGTINVEISYDGTPNGLVGTTTSHPLLIRTAGATAATVSTSQSWTFANNIAVPNTNGLFFNGFDSNWKIYRSSAPDFTRAIITTASLNINIAANSSEGFAIGTNTGNSAYEIKSAGDSLAFQHYFRGIAGIGTNPNTSYTLTVGGGFNATTGYFSGNLRTDGVFNWNGTTGALSYGSGFVTMETNSATAIQLRTNGAIALTLATNQAATFTSSVAMVGGSSTLQFVMAGGGIGMSRSTDYNGIWFNSGTDQNHVLWNDYYGGPTTRTATPTGFDGIKWNIYRGIYLQGGAAGASPCLVITNSSGATADHTVTLYASGTQRLATTTTGVSINGSANISGQAFFTCAFSSYTTDGLFSAQAIYSSLSTPGASNRVRFGYNDYGGGQYYGAIGFDGPTQFSIGHRYTSAGTVFGMGTGYRGNGVLIDSSNTVFIPEKLSIGGWGSNVAGINLRGYSSADATTTYGFILDRGTKIAWTDGGNSTTGEYIYSQTGSPYSVTIHSGGYNAIACPNTSHVYINHEAGTCSIGSTSFSTSYKLYVTGTIYATGDVIAYSDERKKENIVTIENALDKVASMRGVFYNKVDDKNRNVGVIAQEVLKVLPEAVSYAEDKDEYGVKYGNIVGVLIEAIKEQQQQIDELKKQLA